MNFLSFFLKKLGVYSRVPSVYGANKGKGKRRGKKAEAGEDPAATAPASEGKGAETAAEATTAAAGSMGAEAAAGATAEAGEIADATAAGSAGAEATAGATAMSEGASAEAEAGEIADAAAAGSTGAKAAAGATAMSEGASTEAEAGSTGAKAAAGAEAEAGEIAGTDAEAAQSAGSAGAALEAAVDADADATVAEAADESAAAEAEAAADESAAAEAAADENAAAEAAADGADAHDVDPIIEIPLVPNQQAPDGPDGETPDAARNGILDMLAKAARLIKGLPIAIAGAFKGIRLPALKIGKTARDGGHPVDADAMSDPLDISEALADAAPSMHAPPPITPAVKNKPVKKATVKRGADGSESEGEEKQNAAAYAPGDAKSEKAALKKAKKLAKAEAKKAKKKGKKNKDAATQDENGDAQGKDGKKNKAKKKDPKEQKEKKAHKAAQKAAAKAAKQHKKAANKKPKLSKDEKTVLKFEKEQAKHEKKLADFERRATKIESNLNRKAQKREAILEKKNETKAQRREIAGIKKARKLEIKKQRDYWLERGVGRGKRRAMRIMSAMLMIAVLTGGGTALYKSQLIAPYNNFIDIVADSPLKIIPQTLDKPVRYVAEYASASLMRITEIIKGKQKPEDLYYYEADNAERYAAFQEAHPDMDADNVVWQVNSGVDLFLYEDPVLISDLDAAPLVVNKFNSLPTGFRPKDLVSIPGTQMQANRDAYAAFERMQQDAAQQNMNIAIVSAYRSFEYQEVLYNPSVSDTRENLQSRIARPGFSEHHTGLAFDVAVTGGKLTEFEGTPEEGWLKRNAEKYGFIMRYPRELENITGFRNEPWHIRYVGDELVAAMAENGIRTLEEYKVKFIDHKPGDTPEKPEKNAMGVEGTDDPI
ncbi:MAG: D-alanyl-D-alanine carboxypeptidase family protein [Clostridiales Family XIII bacterium]|jgi:D-alanyl-D-alanine carboxypeptidase|nr:D-alanyl-D-alanine carboxypeptidase family protein [Clostridiales Family XIII bacterium]